MLATGDAITPADAAAAMEEIMAGTAPEVVVGAYLTALKVSDRGTAGSPQIIAACADVMLEFANSFTTAGYPAAAPQPTADIVGTGGDGMDTFNVSTCGGMVMAACGVTVAKHGNRSSSGNVGSADFLQALGADIMLGSTETASVLEKVGFCFLFAQKFHPAMKHVGPIRKQIGIPTVFNVLGPLTNPARPEFQLLGVGKKALGPVYAELMRLRGRAAIVVHSTDGIDEISIEKPTLVWEVAGEPLSISEYTISPTDFGVGTHPLTTVTGGTAEERVAAFRKVLDGGDGPYRDFIVINAAAGLRAAGVTPDFKAAADIVKAALDSGKAKETVAAYVKASQEAGAVVASAPAASPATEDAAKFASYGKKIVCVGKNYAAHITEMAKLGAQGSNIPLWPNNSTEKNPVLFLKPTTSYVQEGTPIMLPPPSVGCIHYETELGLVIGQHCKHVSEANALDVLSGYCLALDLTARDMQLAAKEAGMPWTVSKGYDGFCPVSKFVPKSAVPNPQAVEIWLQINGKDVQRGNTKMMLHSVAKLVAYVSTIFTLEPGDVILTGTPEGVGPIVAGDSLKAGITGVIEMSFEVNAKMS